MSRAFAELDTVMEAHIAEVMAAVDVDKFLKARARFRHQKQPGATP